MTFRTSGFGRRIGAGRTRILVPVLLGIAVLIAGFLVFTGIWTNLLWFRSVGFSSVYTKELSTKVLLFFGAGLLMAVVVGANMVIAHRLRPAHRPLSVEQQGLERYRAVIDPHRRLIAAGVLLLLGLLTGSSASGQWKVWLAFMNRTSFGIKDPQFHQDISFYVFTYPFLRLLLGYLFATVILSTLLTVVVHYLYGGLRLQGPGEKASLSARAHLSVLIGVFVLLKAVAYWFDRWGLAGSERGVVTGPSYTDVNAVLPAKTILAVIAVICAALFFVNIVRRGMTLPGVGLVLLVLSAVLVGGVYPLLIQQVQVKPNELAKERRYISRNITATRTAYDVSGVKPEEYGAQSVLTKDQLAEEAQTVSGVRLLDPNVVSPTFQQLQQVRSFYQFPDVLSIDRYSVDGGAPQDMVVAVRELSGSPSGRSGWINDHLIYTHGYGFVSALGSKVTPEGAPSFVEKDIPQSGPLGSFQPRIYFGQSSPDYSIVGTGQAELDYPIGTGADQQNTTYTGSGGVPIGSFFNRLLFSLKYRDPNILLSGAIKSRSKILYGRTPRERVQKVAPWLTLDGSPYPAVVNGRVVWIVDGYTTSNAYPYSERMSLGDSTADTTTDTKQTVAKQSDDQINYMRNSIKATVDAYDGTVKLYQWDDTDPIVNTWKKAFPGTVLPKSAIPATLLAHLRYPQDLFKVQRRVLAKYHVTDAGDFYGGQGFWDVPQDPNSSGKTQPPYYLSLKMPGDAAPEFSLTSSFTPRGRPNLAAFLAVSATSGAGYGKLRLLEVQTAAGQDQIPGPGQVKNTFESNAKVKQALFDLRSNGTKTVEGNLLALPFGGGFLYVEPVYAQTAGGTQQEPYPLLSQVEVLFGKSVGVAPTLGEALTQIFAGAQTPTGTGTQTPTTAVSEDVKSAIKDVEDAYNTGQAALKRGDWTAYGKAQQDLKAALDRLSKATTATPPKTTPTPTPTPSP